MEFCCEPHNICVVSRPYTKTIRLLRVIYIVIVPTKKLFKCTQKYLVVNRKFD